MFTRNDLRTFASSLDFSALRGPRPPLKHLKVVIVGAGVIGGSVGAWIAPHYDALWFHDLPALNDAMRRKGVTTYPQGDRTAAVNTPVQVIDDLAELPDADVVVLGVKTYSLDSVARMVKDKLGDRPLIVAMQNGVENQSILPKYFSKVIYCVISYNAWMDEPAVIGYQKKGPLHLGTRYNELQDELHDVARIFNLGVETEITAHIGDDAHCKLIINLTNSLTTLVGHGFVPLTDEALFQKLLTNLLYEGVRVVSAAGYHESRLGGMPPWAVIKAGATLPRAVTKGMFRRNLRKMVMSSMAQDVLQRRGAATELETINGYLVKLAARHGVAIPFNKAVYDLCRASFADPAFAPLPLERVQQEVLKNL